MTNKSQEAPNYLAGWDRFWFRPRTPDPLGVIRIVVGVIAFLQFVQVFASGWEWFGADGLFDSATGLHFIGDGVEGTGSEYRLSILYRHPNWITPIAIAGLAASLCMILGLGARIAPAVAWVALSTLSHRAPLLVATHELLLAAALLYLVIDSGRTQWGLKPAVSSGPPRISSNLVIRLFQCHAFIWIAFSLASMLSFPVWWNGQAAWVLIRDSHGWLTLPSDWQWVGQCVTHLVLILQAAILFCMLSPSCLWLGRWLLVAFIFSILIMTGDWMYAGILFAYSLAIWPIPFFPTKEAS